MNIQSKEERILDRFAGKAAKANADKLREDMGRRLQVRPIDWS